MNIIGKKNFYFLVSFLLIVPGLISLVLYGLNLSIDFTGGSRIIYQDTQRRINAEKLRQVLQSKGVKVSSIQISSNNTYSIRAKTISQKTHEKINKEIPKEVKGIKEIGFETVGPTVGGETTVNAVKAIVIASILIVLYIVWSFRSVPKPASSFRFGICAIAALLHDVLFVVGVFSLLGHFLHVEVDSLFVTAVLTVIGFSVHDTIVVFDRIRENLRRMNTASFASVVNDSILQTIGRSINTSLTVLLVLFTLLLFGGESTRWFVAALLLGIVSGTYSSIFNAAPLLVTWQELSERKKK